MSDFNDATRNDQPPVLNLDVIQQVIETVAREYQLWGQWPTATHVAATIGLLNLREEPGHE